MLEQTHTNLSKISKSFYSKAVTGISRISSFYKKLCQLYFFIVKGIPSLINCKNSNMLAAISSQSSWAALTALSDLKVVSD